MAGTRSSKLTHRRSDSGVSFGSSITSTAASSPAASGISTNAQAVVSYASGCDDAILPLLKVHNIVCTTELGCVLDLRTIANQGRNATYSPKRFAACVIRQRDPKTTALVFANGKMVVLGAKSFDDSVLGARKFIRMIQKMGFKPKFNRADYRLQNLVAGVDVGFYVRMERLGLLLRTEQNRIWSWEPEIFAGGIITVEAEKSDKVVS